MGVARIFVEVESGYLLRDCWGNGDKCTHDLWVETGPSLPLNEFDCFPNRQWISIGSLGCQRIERISHSEDPGAQWNLITLESVRIAAAVISFMMIPNDWDDGIMKADWL